jgi:hypothetical protein
MFKHLLVVVVLLLTYGCGNDSGPATLEVSGPVSDTQGLRCDSVSTHTDGSVVVSPNYHLYCFLRQGQLQVFLTSEATVVVNNGSDNVILWGSVPFPSNGTYDCMWTISEGSDESPVSVHKAVTKIGDVYQKAG